MQRINFQDNAQETSIQQNGGPRAIVWKDVIRLMNVQVNTLSYICNVKNIY